MEWGICLKAWPQNSPIAGGRTSRKKAIRFFGTALTLMTALTTASCGAHQVGGKTARQEFADARVVDLVDASCVGDRDRIARLIRAGADPNEKGNSGDTPIFWAVDCGNAVGIEALLDAGADPNYVISGNFSATYAAAGGSDPEPLKLLLKHGGDPNASASDAPLQSALGRALELGVHEGRWENYDILLKAGANINRGDGAGSTIATAAAGLGALDKVEELLDRGYDYDLVQLGAIVQIRPAHEGTARWRVMQILKAKGVKFPVLSRAELYCGRVSMRADRSLYVIVCGGR
jgi:hypothetical protein